MNDVLLNDLRKKAARRELLVIAGAGVSISATDGNDLASWRGLLNNGVETLPEGRPASRARLGRSGPGRCQLRRHG